MLLLLAVQILVLNHLHIFGYATPLLVGYMLICFRQTNDRITLMVWGVVTGLLFDLFSNTMGMCCASMTLLGFVRPALLRYFTPISDTEGFRPSIRSMKIGNYTLYTLSCMGVLHGAFYLLDVFSIAKLHITLLAIIVGSVVATAIVVLTEMTRNDKNRL